MRHNPNATACELGEAVAAVGVLGANLGAEHGQSAGHFHISGNRSAAQAVHTRNEGGAFLAEEFTIGSNRGNKPARCAGSLGGSDPGEAGAVADEGGRGNTAVHHQVTVGQVVCGHRVKAQRGLVYAAGAIQAVGLFGHHGVASLESVRHRGNAHPRQVLFPFDGDGQPCGIILLKKRSRQGIHGPQNRGVDTVFHGEVVLHLAPQQLPAVLLIVQLEVQCVDTVDHISGLVTHYSLTRHDARYVLGQGSSHCGQRQARHKYAEYTIHFDPQSISLHQFVYPLYSFTDVHMSPTCAVAPAPVESC